MTVPATKPIGVSIQKLEYLISTSTTFQSAVGVSSAADALRFIFYPDYTPPDQNAKPFAVITPPPEALQTERVAGGGKNYFTLSGSLTLQLCWSIGNLPAKDEFINFLNFAEGVHAHLLDQAAVSDNLSISGCPINDLSQSSEMVVSENRSHKPFYRATYSVQWGI